MDVPSGDKATAPALSQAECIRAVTPSVPPRVDYALTDLGRSMLEPVRALGAWAQAHIPAMDAARARYDGKSGG